MGRIARRAQGADDNDLLALHAVNQVNRIVVCRAMIAPVGQHEGVEQIDHFLVDIADVIGADVVGRYRRGRLGQAESIAGDGGKNDGDFIHERVILSCLFHQLDASNIGRLRKPPQRLSISNTDRLA